MTINMIVADIIPGAERCRHHHEHLAEASRFCMTQRHVSLQPEGFRPKLRL